MSQLARGLLLLLLYLVVSPANGQEATDIPSQSTPLGGIGAGVVHLLPNGTFGQVTLTRNATQPIANLPGSFSALWIRHEGKADAFALATQNSYHLPNIPQLDYQSLFPEAILDYGVPSLPVEVRCRALSPFIPHDKRSTSYPASLFLYELRNRTSSTLEISIAFSWENFLGVGGTARYGAIRQRTGTSVATLPAEQGYFGLRFNGVPLTAGNSVEERLQDNTTGDMTLLVQPRNKVKVTTATWNTLRATPEWWEEFRTTGEVSGNTAMGVEGKRHPAGVIAIRFTLKPNDFVTIPFALAWHLPRHYTLSGVDFGTYADHLFPDSFKTAQSLLTDWRLFLALTEEWQRRLLASNLPRWLVQYLLQSVGVLSTHTLHGREGEFAVLNSVGGELGDKSADFASVESNLALSGLLCALFPDLNRANLERLAQTQASNGSFHAFTGNAEFGYALAGAQVGKTTEPDVASAVRNTIAYILLVAQHVQQTEDIAPLGYHLPKIKRALAFLKTAPPLKRSPANALLYFVALQGGDRLLSLADEPELVQTLAQLRASLQAIYEPPSTLAESLLSILNEKPEAGMVQIYPLAHSIEGRAAVTPNRGIAWYLLATLTGFAYDPKQQEVRLTPHIPGTWRTLAAPVFMPNYWGRMEFKPRVNGYLVNFRLDRMLPMDRSVKIARPHGGLLIQTVRIPRPRGRELSSLSLYVSVGKDSLGIQKIEPVEGDLVITLQSPLTLSVGDLFEIVVR